MHAMLLAGLLLLLGVRGTAGYRASRGDVTVPESLAQRRQLFRQLGVVGKARLEGAKCETEVQGGVPTVVMLGADLEGKSTTTCVLSGNPALAHVAADGQAHSETSESCIHRASWFFPYDHSEPLYLIDTPGFAYTDGGRLIRDPRDDIVGTLKGAGHAHAILWVIDTRDERMNVRRQNTFRFMRAYFGKDLYKHLVVVYTHYRWRQAKGRRMEMGKARVEALKEHHRRMMEALNNHVELDYWPDWDVEQGVNDTIMQLPYFGFNTYTVDLEEDEGGGVTFVDDDIADDDYNEDDPDGFFGVFNPTTFRKVRPNSATQLRDLKAKILEISRRPPMDLTNLRWFREGCKAALEDTVETDPAVFGQHLTDCVEGQQYKLLKDKVAPYVSGLQDGPVFAAFGISAYTGGRGPAGSSLRVEAMKELGIPDSARESAEAFASYGAYQACRDAQPGQGAAVLVERLSTCLGGIASGHGVPALVGAMTERLFGEGAKAAMSAAYIAQVVAEIGKLPEHARAAVAAHVDVQGLMRSLLPW